MNISSTLESVQVYRQGALITRRAELAEPTEQVVLEGLPLSLLDSTLRVELTGESPPQAVDLQLTLQVPAEQDPDRPPAHDQALQAARLDVHLAEATLERLHSQQARVSAIELTERPEPEDAPVPPPPVEARVALLHFRSEQLRALEPQLAQARDALRHAREHQEELEEARRQRTEARKARQDELRKAAVVQLRGGEGACTLRLSYRVPGARWAPAYSLRLNAEMSSAELEVRALIAQRTGEDWDQARVTLSTALAQSWAELPELPSLRIGRAQAPPSRSGWREAPEGAQTLLADYRRAYPVPAAEPEAEAADSPAPLDDAFFGMEQAAEEVSSPSEPPPAPSPAPVQRSRSSRRPHKAKKKSMPAFSRGGPSGGAPAPQAAAAMPGRAEAPPPPRPLMADADQLDYARLRLSQGSVRLVQKTRVEIMVELSAVTAVNLAPLTRASSLARSAGDQLPAGHTLARSDDGFDHAWVASHPLSVPSDGAWHSLPLRTESARVSPRFVCVPRISEQVFRTVEWINPLKAPLLRGPCDVLVDGGWLLTTELASTPPEGMVELGLGVEQSIKVSRNARYREESSGLLNRTQDLHHEVDIELRNLRGTPASIEIRERLPAAGENDDDVSVDLLHVEPQWESWEQDPPIEGSHRWRVELASGQARTLALHYVVHLPSEHELSGGNRREP
ncbi:MAG TPA: DUF4139 domain-containing protein [Myxococcota bacterium]|nr:DUF4139 domain-containing protein [Myxococcota bacterium]